MKKLIILLLLASVILSSCKKKDSNNYIGYNIRVNVDDGVSYSLKVNDRQTINHNVVPPAKNASFTETSGGEIGTTLYVTAVLAEIYKDKEIEIIVTRNDNGAVIRNEKSTKSLTVSWTVKK